MFYSSIPRNYLVLASIALISIITIGLLWGSNSDSLNISSWTGKPKITGNSAAPINALARPISDSQMQLEINPGLYTGQEQDLRSSISASLTYTSERFGSHLNAPVTVVVEQQSDCGLNGITYSDVRSVYVYTCDAISPDRAVAILAHEFIHQLAQDRYGQQHLSADLILSEGLATWGAGSYWLGGQPDFRSYVASQRRQGIAYPLAMSYVGQGTAVMNALYYQWGSFVEFLIQSYGRERFDKLYSSGASAPGSADYIGVYGKSLDTLEREWESWLNN